ncbi:Kelch repeat-containing protein, partial [[Eubacterium] cellulosolvens]
MVHIYGTKEILLYGGSKLSSLGDTWTYNYTTNTWTNKRPKYNPGYRQYYVMAPIYGTDKVVLFGGIELQTFMENVYNDTWIYDLSENNWTNKKPANHPEEQRYGSAIASIYHDDKVIMFNGGDSYHNSETWVYDLSDNLWTKKIQCTSPDNRSQHAMASIYGTDKV